MRRNSFRGRKMVNDCLGLTIIIESLDAAGANEAAKLLRATRDDCEAALFVKNAIDRDFPPIMIRGINFATAIIRWASTGMPRRSQSEINDRLAICQACPHFIDNHCRVCGCPCVETNQLINKLALATEACPLGKWK